MYIILKLKTCLGSSKLSKVINPKQTDLVEQIETTITRLNDKISELKLWNVGQLNQLEFQVNFSYSNLLKNVI